MPYRVHIDNPPPEALDLLMMVGALDVESVGDTIVAVLPDTASQDDLARALGRETISASPAVGRDDASVWLVSSRAVSLSGLQIVTSEAPASPGALRLTDSSAFGSGHHPTTAMCIESVSEALALEPADSLLDIGTGTGILALAALKMGVLHATGIDIDTHALKVAAENALANGLSDRLQLVHGGPDSVSGVWPVVVANVLAAPLIELAPAIVRRVSGRGRLILSGIPPSLEGDVRNAYVNQGMHCTGSAGRGGWIVITFRASW